MQIRGIFEVLPNICNRDFLQKYYKNDFLHGSKNASKNTWIDVSPVPNYYGN